MKDRPLFLMNPKTGKRESLKWISKDEPFKSLGIMLSANLCWDFEYQYLLDQLDPLIRQVKAARKIDLAWDVFVAAVNSKIVGLMNYHMGVVPFSRAHSTILNNKVTMALKNTKAASPHQLRCEQPIGVAAPDLSLSAAQIKIQLALNIVHSNDQEGQALRWCLRSVKLHSKSRAFPWENVFLWQSAKKPGFVDAVAQSLHQIGLCIRTDSALFRRDDPSQCLPLSFEQRRSLRAPGPSSASCGVAGPPSGTPGQTDQADGLVFAIWHTAASHGRRSLLRAFAISKLIFRKSPAVLSSSRRAARTQ